VSIVADRVQFLDVRSEEWGEGSEDGAAAGVAAEPADLAF
jgi:hypothetical protein